MNKGLGFSAEKFFVSRFLDHLVPASLWSFKINDIQHTMIPGLSVSVSMIKCNYQVSKYPPSPLSPTSTIIHHHRSSTINHQSSIINHQSSTSSSSSSSSSSVLVPHSHYSLLFAITVFLKVSSISILDQATRPTTETCQYLTMFVKSTKTSDGRMVNWVYIIYLEVWIPMICFCSPPSSTLDIIE